MFKIGEFSKLAKTSVKTLRFYDEINLFKPSMTLDNGYRYYSINDLKTLVTIIELRNVGLSINDIKSVLDGADLKSVLSRRSEDIKKEINQNQNNLSLIEKILNQVEKGEFMKNYQAKEITLPEIKVYYRHGVIKSMSNMVDFILEAGAECRENNPDLKCINDYCFITYEAQEYQEKNVELEYLEQVEKFGKESENIKFKTLKETKAISVVHKGSYSKLSEAYAYALNWVKENGYEITDKIREVYINGCWNTDNEENYVTEIQVPVK